MITMPIFYLSFTSCCVLFHWVVIHVFYSLREQEKVGSDIMVLLLFSACTSASLEPSYVLRAIGTEEDLAHSSIRLVQAACSDVCQICLGPFWSRSVCLAVKCSEEPPSE